MNDIQGRKNPLGYAPVAVLIAKFAVPSIISMLAGAAYNITDQIFISHVVGIQGTTAASVILPVMIFTMAFAHLAGAGIAANFNICIGSKRIEEAKRFVGTGLVLISILGILIFSILFFFKTPVLLLCGAAKTMLPYAKAYLSIIVYGIPFHLFISAGNNLIRADGSPAYAMICTLTGMLLNILLDWLFLFVFKWGMQGAAAATVVGQIASFLICLRYFSSFRSFKIRRNMLRLRMDYAAEIIKLGTPDFINHTIMVLISILINNTLSYYGALSAYGSEIPLAVSGAVGRLDSVLAAFCVGIAQGCQPILGFNIGACNYKRVKETYITAISASLLISMAVFVLFQAFPRQITGIFGTEDELYFQFADRYLRIFMMMVCVSGMQPISESYFTCTGNVRQGIALSLLKQAFFVVLLLLFPALYGIDGFLYAGPVSDLMTFVLTIALISWDFRKYPEIQRHCKTA